MYLKPKTRYRIKIDSGPFRKGEIVHFTDRDPSMPDDMYRFYSETDKLIKTFSTLLDRRSTDFDDLLEEIGPL